MDINVSPEVASLLDEAARISVLKGKYYVGVEHIFESVIANSTLLPAAIADKHLQALKRVLQHVLAKDWKGATPVVDGEIYHTPRSIAVSKEANRIAVLLRSGPATGGHLLLAMLLDPTTAPSQTMDEIGVDRQGIIENLQDALIDGAGRIREGALPAKESSPDKSTTVRMEGVDLSFELFTSDMTQLALAGDLSFPDSRDKEMMEVIQVLTRKEKNNVIVIGEAGVGKTKVVEGLAVGCANGQFSELLGNKRILELNLAALMSGTELRGAFEKKMIGLLKELESSDDTILFIDEIHLIMGAGSTDGDTMDVANLLKPALGRGRLQCIGATTSDEYRKFISKDPAIERRFQTVKVEPLSLEDTHRLLKKLVSKFERHHSVTIGSGTCSAAVLLSDRYMPGRQLPDKAIDVLDQACSRFHLKLILAETKPEALKGTVDPRIAGKVTPYDVRKVISQMTSISVDELSTKERSRLRNLDTLLNQRVIGQQQAVSKIVPSIKKSRAGLADPNRPDAVFFFHGPTGVGKTQLAKDLAEIMFGSTDLLITFDMSEYTEEHSVSRLIGAPPGYVGSEEEGLLTGSILNTPYCILLFDEIEKAHSRVFDLFLPILDEGRLKDSRGREVSFKNAIIIFTSNAAGDISDSENRDAVVKALGEHFRPEFINRIDEFVPFLPLESEDVRQILRQMIDGIRLRLRDRKMGIRMFESAYRFLIEQGYDRDFGARELKRTVERYIADPISHLILEKEIAAGDMIDIQLGDGQLTYTKGIAESQ